MRREVFARALNQFGVGWCHKTPPRPMLQDADKSDQDVGAEERMARACQLTADLCHAGRAGSHTDLSGRRLVDLSAREAGHCRDEGPDRGGIFVAVPEIWAKRSGLVSQFDGAVLLHKHVFGRLRDDGLPKVHFGGIGEKTWHLEVVGIQ